MARTKQALSARRGSSFYRKITPKRKSRSLGNGRDYEDLLNDLKNELSLKLESQIEQSLKNTAGKISRSRSQSRNEMDYDEDYLEENDRQHNHPSWPWEPVSHGGLRTKKNEDEEEHDLDNDWRRLTKYEQPEKVYPDNYDWEERKVMRMEPKESRPSQYKDYSYKPMSRYGEEDNRRYQSRQEAQIYKPSEVKVKEENRSNLASDIEELKSKVTFLEKELMTSYQRESELKNSVEKLEQELSSRHSGLRQQLDTLRKDIVIPSEPAKEENKLTSLSMQLTQVMQSMNTMMSDEGGNEVRESKVASVPVDEVAKKAVEEKSEPKSSEVKAKEDKPEEKSKDGVSKETGKIKKKKVLWLFASLVLVLGGVMAGMFFFFNGPTEADPELIKNYLPESSGSPSANDQSQASEQENNTANNSEAGGAVQGATTSTSPPPGKFEQAHAEIAYGETRWDTHKNPQLGVEFDYPSNSTNVVRTDTSVTVLRKTGYIFKIMYIESALDLDDYWNQIKARNLIHKVSETKFRDLPALFLELDDQSDYPGNRYLVKRDDVIYDIWYATSSPNLSDDDAKRIDIILNSFKFIE